MKWFLALLAGFSLLMTSGCASIDSKQVQWYYPPMARPLQPTIQQEVKIVRLSQLLQREKLSDEVRAKLFYERGNAYDAVGLRNLARIDFEQSLQMNPAQPDVFNILGVYYTEIGQYDSAYDAFDSTLEMEPDNLYALRNQAVALYYGQRPHLALEVVDQMDQVEVNDPFNALWRYFIESELAPADAKKTLSETYEHRTEKQWGWLLVSMVLENTPDKEVFKQILAGTKDNTVLARRLTEAYFYLGKRYQLQGKYADAVSLYKLAISFNVYEYVEHRYAFLELENIYLILKQDK
ncbi:Lipoprotein NlpI precursor [Vibrio aerogenes CECT 7868]|uniref:Lipoprotein NlpI n=1 Tax=Vibrio aerogenes CECT 7868 TaxID=1216006 RepID=A0A1M5Y9P5_9VIBR|nr:lipoprotein NlpI [Vibrio aerogenes]SHI08811.1 Lipoprotein NlpI precursor [Vibrio aerogenes CECT 7868]